MSIRGDADGVAGMAALVSEERATSLRWSSGAMAVPGDFDRGIGGRMRAGSWTVGHRAPGGAAMARGEGRRPAARLRLRGSRYSEST